MESTLELIRRIRDQKHKVLIFGAGKTGIALANFFVKVGIAAEVWDEISRAQFFKSQQNQRSLDSLEQQGIKFHFDTDQKIVSEDIALLVPSPGISHKSSLFKIDGISDLHKIGELELGMQILFEAFGAKQIVITGSNGKSTTTALVHHILKTLNFNSVLCGNIGEPVIDKVPASALDTPAKRDLILTIEASSYQLEDCKLCKPDVAVMLNLTENHLERHGTMVAYLEAKKNLVRRFNNDSTLVVNADDSFSNDFIQGINSRLLYIGSLTDCAARVDVKNKEVVFQSDEGSITYSQNFGVLIGSHNLYNIAAAVLACEAIGCNLSKAVEAAYKFTGLEHRLEQIRIGLDGLAINDSKATTVSASLAACKAVVESDLNRKVILMLGGQEKAGSDWSPIVNYINQNLTAFKQVGLFGECRHKLKNLFEVVGIPLELFETLSSAVKSIKAKLGSDNVILLSPGCASFDEFTDFEDRGRVFKRLLVEA